MTGESQNTQVAGETTPPSTGGQEPLASVVVCVYNRPQQVITCLESLLRSDYPNFEIIVVDDGSTDETPQVVADFAAKCSQPPIRVVRHPTNRGLCAARNTGIAAAGGQIILYTDSDCTVDPQWIGRIVEAFGDERVAAASGLVVDVPPRNPAEWAAAGNTRLSGSSLARRLVGNNMAIRRVIADAFPFDESIRLYADEEDLARRLVSGGHHIAFVRDAIVYHDHPMTLRKYLRQAWLQGQGSAYYWRKHGIWIGRDLIFLVLALLSLPLVLIRAELGWLAAGFFALHTLAHLYNERFLKGKSWIRAIYVLPVVLLYTAVKTVSVLYSHARYLTSIRVWGRKAPRSSAHR